MRHAQRWWLERAARDCVDRAMARDVEEHLANALPRLETRDVQMLRDDYLHEAAALLVRVEMLDRELARRKP